jgi:hypothetical protein
MNSEAHDNELLLRQVQKLEREIRFIKRWVTMAAVALLGLILVLRAFDRHRVSTQQVVAKDFVLVDGEGRARVRVAVFPQGSGMELYAAGGERRVQLVGSGEEAALNLYIPMTAVREAASVNLYRSNVLLSSLRGSFSGSQLEMHSQPANGAAVLALADHSASLILSGANDAVPKPRLSANASEACTALTGASTTSAASSLCLHAPGLPSLELADLVGDRAVIGIPQGRDLNGNRNSAASLILKYKSGKKVKVAPAEH